MASGTSLMVQWLKLWAPNAEDVGSIPGGGTKIPHAVWCGPKKKRYGCLLIGRLLSLLEKAMAPHSSTLAWKIPWMEDYSSILAWRIPWTEPGGLQCIGLQRVGHDWMTNWGLFQDLSYPAVSEGEGNGNPLQYSCLENSVGGGAW